MSQSAAAASDCESASSAIELAICGDESLADADAELLKLLEQLRSSTQGIEDNQATWLTKRNACDDTACLRREYSDRLIDLHARLALAQEPAPLPPAPAAQTFETSFDCAQATTRVEHLICENETLAAADVEMSGLYNAMPGTRSTAIAEQAAWLRDIRNVCQDAECLSDAYLKRISALEAQSQHPQGAAPMPTAPLPTPQPQQRPPTAAAVVFNDSASHSEWHVPWNWADLVFALGFFLGWKVFPKNQRRETEFRLSRQDLLFSRVATAAFAGAIAASLVAWR